MGEEEESLRCGGLARPHEDATDIVPAFEDQATMDDPPVEIGIVARPQLK